ncbi:hypothetical protein GOY17_07290 [Lysobacter soli]|uniref:hypothetical protein n=1 Tax=Lysobacter soli TaxID=453783 RepID=UPI0012EE0C19|nr:hypothetical protein [Lysobacter soli]QGW64737.1 hypothetical protein GOY17_07290 [Lysobacter soli]
MNYPDGQEVRVGHRVRLGEDSGGVVVFSIDRDEYAADYPKAEWAYLEAGVMIRFPKDGLIHFAEEDDDLELLSRAQREGDAG